MSGGAEPNASLSRSANAAHRRRSVLPLNLMPPIALGLGLLLAGCPPHSTNPPCSFDGGSSNEVAFNLLSAFLFDAGTACGTDADCALLQLPCNLRLQGCEQVAEIAIPTAQQPRAQEVVSTIAAEQCPSNCISNDFGGFLGIGNAADGGCPSGASAAVCESGQCAVGTVIDFDAGGSQFESHCGFGCTEGQFCDIEALEQTCPSQPGLFLIGNGDAGGVCAPRFDVGATCATDQACGEDAICLSLDNSPCDASRCGDAGCGASCACSTPTSCPTPEGQGCPPGCRFAFDNRACNVCVCSSCPPTLDAG